MNTKIFITAMLVSLITSFNSMATEMISVNSTDKLSKEHLANIQHTQELLNEYQHKFVLPVEAVSIADTESAHAKAQWDKAYFMYEHDCISCLIVPLSLEGNKNVKSQLKVINRKDGYFYSVVETISHNAVINSNLDGNFINQTTLN